MFFIPATSPIDITKTTKFMNRGTDIVKTNIESTLQIPKNPLNNNEVNIMGCLHELTDLMNNIGDVESG